ncbi:MAG: DUF4215 domain-containing protein, partial [Nanoarchaeota archaeon]|nr:DUF4215 domain-containing protein [Nanoarchaeota archaeon]
IIILIIITFISNSAYSAVCTDSAIIWSVEFSINDNTFSQEFNGTSGVIQKIYKNDTINKYSLWQSDKIASISTYAWGSPANILYVYGGNDNSFNIDTDFTNNLNNMLVLNNNSEEFILYYNLTLKNTGTCDYNNHAFVGNYGGTSIRHYGINNYNSYYSHFANPSGTYEFKSMPLGGLKSQIYQISSTNIKRYGILYIRIGPDTFQAVNTYFWINGSAITCGDNIVEYGETCDDGNLINGDGCSNTCQIEICNDEIRIDSIVYSLNDSSFSHDYDGNSGIIQTITYNETDNDYQLWQTNNLPFRTTWQWDGNPSTNTHIYGGSDNKVGFNIDASYAAAKNRILILNPSSNNFDLYYNLTLKNTGTCTNSLPHVDRLYSTNSIRYSGGNSHGYTQPNSFSINAHWRPENFALNETRSRIYNVASNNVIYYGLLYLRPGPYDRRSGPEFQLINNYFWLDGMAISCGNGILEGPEVCDDGNNINGDGCSSTCFLEPAITPIIKWESHQTPSDLWLGRNITPGQNITLFYSIHNPNTLHNMTVSYESLLYTEPFNLHNTNGWYRYDDDVTLTRHSEQQTVTYYTIPTNSTIYINKTFYVPAYSQVWQDVLERFFLFEQFRYKRSTQAGGTYFPKNSDGSYDYDWWQTTSNMTSYTTWWGSGWYKRDWGFGSYNSQYSIYGLEPNNPTLAVTTNDEGIPAVEVEYHHGTVRASYMMNITPGTFFLKNQLKFQNNTVIYNQNHTIDKFYKRNDGNSISPYEEYRWWVGGYKNELAVTELISFPLYDFNLVNGKFVKFDVTPYINRTGRKIALAHTSISDIYPINLNLIKMSVDSPLNIKPLGSKGFDELYARIVMFNYYEYSILGAKLDVEFKDTNDDPAVGLFEAEYINQSIIPSGAAYPIGIKIKYIGPNPTEDKDYKAIIKLSYYDWLANETKEVKVETSIKLFNDIISEKFIDLIPMGLNYTLVNINNESLVTLMVANQGTENSGFFPIEFYTKEANESSFTLLETKTMKLNKGQMKTATFTFTPTSFEKVVLKAVINQNKSVNETALHTNAHKNNIITSITAVRDIDVVLEYVYPVYEDAVNGIIPFKVFARNKG